MVERQHDDLGGGEPVLLLALVEHQLHGAHPHSGGLILRHGGGVGAGASARQPEVADHRQGLPPDRDPAGPGPQPERLPAAAEFDGARLNLIAQEVARQVGAVARVSELQREAQFGQRQVAPQSRQRRNGA